MRTGEIIITDAAYTALTTDVICQYAFAADGNFLDEDDFKLAWRETLIGATEGGALLRQFPWMFPLMNGLLESLLRVRQPCVGLASRRATASSANIERNQSPEGKGHLFIGSSFMSCAGVICQSMKRLSIDCVMKARSW